jgi:riboflavin synthase alpha subunit
VIHEDSNAVDGINPTAASIKEDGFSTWVIASAYEIVVLRGVVFGQTVNSDAELLGK